MFEAVQFIEVRAGADPQELVLGEFQDESDAVTAARAAKVAFIGTGSDEFAWWIVREDGAELANFIADSKSSREFVLDLTSGQLLEIRS